MNVAIVNPVWDADLATFEQALSRYSTLTGWSEAVAAAGAGTVTAYQRFRRNDRIERNGVTYVGVRDADSPRPPSWSAGDAPLHAAVAAGRPDLIHLNGVMHPRLIRRLRAVLPHATIVVQDHGGFDPDTVSALRRRWLRSGIAAADAALVSSPGQAEAWRRGGIAPPALPVYDVMESSRDVAPVARDEARRQSGVTGSPALLWVGHLIANKDPLTVLRGAAKFFDRQPGARLTLVYRRADLESDVRQLVATTAALAGRVELVGRVPYADMPAYFSAADLYVAGSRREGSGYSAIEALACGATPVLSGIAPFRALTADGTVGLLWRTGDAASLADALARAAEKVGDAQRAECRKLFERSFSWPALGRRTVEIYEDVVRGRGSSRR